jgi:large subunit ribosomal protein L9
MKVILLEDIKTLGKTGDKVEVAEGYARNYLVPRKLASALTRANQAVFDNEVKARAKARDRAKGVAEKLAEQIKGVSLTIARMAGEEDKLFGSVTNGDIAAALKEQGVEVDKRKIEMDAPLKSLGIHQVPVRLHPDVEGTIKVWVVKQGNDEEGQEEEVQDHRAPLMTEEERAAEREEKAKGKAKPAEASTEEDTED